jgi:hypothetical protein
MTAAQRFFLLLAAALIAAVVGGFTPPQRTSAYDALEVPASRATATSATTGEPLRSRG